MTLLLTSIDNAAQQNAIRDVWRAYFAEQFAQLPESIAMNMAELQISAKLQSYQTHWPHMQQKLITVDSTVVGLILLSEDEEQLHIIDLVVTKQFRHRGIAKQVLNYIYQQAAQDNKTAIKLSVAMGNPALNFYASMGYKVTGQTDTQIYMERSTGAKH